MWFNYFGFQKRVSESIQLRLLCRLDNKSFMFSAETKVNRLLFETVDVFSSGVQKNCFYRDVSFSASSRHCYQLKSTMDLSPILKHVWRQIPSRGLFFFSLGFNYALALILSRFPFNFFWKLKRYCNSSEWYIVLAG